MNSENIEKLRIACNQFYLGKYLDQPLMDDIEFDSLRKEYESEGASVKDMVEWDSDMTMINDPMPGLAKIQVTDNDLCMAVTNYLTKQDISDFSLNYKYDGSSLKCYYKNGKLQKILGTPDEKYGIVRTKAFWNLVPHEVDPSIKTLQGEVLVDARNFGELARNKANGLTNSKWKDDEVESEAYIRVYRVEFSDGEWSYERNRSALKSLPIIWKSRIHLVTYNYGTSQEFSEESYSEVPVFKVAEEFTPKKCPKSSIIEEKSSGIKFQVDGVVMYSKLGVQGFKFYYTQSAITRVTNIAWQYQSNGGWMPKIQFEGVTLNDKSIWQAASGGVPNLMYMKMGVGAKIRVILANMTIPKVIEVLEPSEVYNFPKCECGYQTSEKDIVGSTIKCHTNGVCSMREDKWSRIIQYNYEWYKERNELSTPHQYLKLHPAEALNSVLQVDRWDISKKCKFEDTESEYKKIFKSVFDNDLDVFYKLFYNDFYYSDLCWDLFENNYRTSFIVLRNFINSNTNKDEN